MKTEELVARFKELKNELPTLNLNQYDYLTTDTGRESFITDNPTGAYHGKNDEDELLYISLEQSVGMEVKVFQKNKWVRIDEYSERGLLLGELYEGRWNNLDD